MFDPKFVEKWLQTIVDSEKHGVHLLFNEWWDKAPTQVVDAYVRRFQDIPEVDSFLAKRYYAEPMTIKQLAAFPAGSVGRGYHDFLVENNLEERLAVNYKAMHHLLELNGVIKAMPEQFKYAVLRGYQIHDFLHLVTGYGTDPYGEVALQAFSLAQMRFPYMAMWVSVLAAQLAFVDPDSTELIMDALADGWLKGKQLDNIMFLEYETMLDRPLTDLQRQYGLA